MNQTTKTITDLRLLGDWGLTSSLVLGLILAIAAWMLYRREVWRRPGSERWTLPTLRSVAVFLIILILTGPVLHHRKTIGELARVLVFIDASKSMSVSDDFMDPKRKLLVGQQYGWWDPDVLKTNWLGMPVTPERLTNAIVSAIEKFDAATRWQRTEQLLLDERDGLLPQLIKKHNVEFWAITGNSPQRWWSVEQSLKLPKVYPGKADSDITDLNAVIASRIAQKHDEKCAVVVISDGLHNSGNSPLEPAKIAGERNIPVFTVGIGALERPNDLAVLDITAPQTVFFEDHLKGDVNIKDDMPPGQKFSIKIEENGETLWTKELITEHTHLRKVEFDFPIKELIEAKRGKVKDAEYSSFPLAMKVSITALTGEKDPTNNVSLFRTRAMTQKRKLLLLDGRPRWETRYLKNMFERDPQWEVNALVAGTEVNNEWEHGDKPGQLPATREALFMYDLIIFGEVPTRLVGQKDMEWIKDFINARGGGIVFIDGQRELLRAYTGTTIGPLLPVEWLTAQSKDVPSAMRLTDRGAGYVPIRLSANTEENSGLWKQLRPPHWVAATKPLAGAETLVETVVSNKTYPTIVLRSFGAGKVLFMGTDETWRWRYDVADKYQDAFWHQIANGIMEPTYAVRNKFVALDAGGVNYQEGDSAELRIRLFDDKGRAITKGKPSIILSRDGKQVASIPLSADENSGGTFRGKTGQLVPGDYEVRVDSGNLVPETPDMPVQFHVQKKTGDASRELAELSCNEELLQQMARVSGGEYFREETAAKLIGKLEPLSNGRVEESETVLWQSWWWFIPVIGLLTTEWVLRKRAGLI